MNQGLSAAEAQARAQIYGPNDIIEPVGGGWRLLVRETARDPMLWFLAFTSAMFAFTGDTRGAIVLLIAIFPLLGMDAFLHRRTHASVEGLGSHLATQAVVERDGARVTISSVEVVPGDLAIVGVGEVFPADGLIVRGIHLQVDESILTGEAYPVHKEPLIEAAHRLDGNGIDRRHWVHAGTRLLTGEARMHVVNTGGRTLYGEIVRSAARGVQERTALQNAVARLVAVLVVIAILMCLVLAVVRWSQGHGLLDAATSAVTLAVAAMPEEFPVVLAFFLGVGVFRLARQQALVRRAVVVENIGRVTCICSDKTGTITEGHLRLAHVLARESGDAHALLTIAATASRRETGDPLDVAILDAAGESRHMEILASFPFTEDRKRETSVTRAPDGLQASMKGAPEIVLRMCALNDVERRDWEATVNEYADSGHKVIACANATIDAGEWSGSEPQQGYHFAGLLAFEDPVRDGVCEALKTCREASIHVVMVTGDHPATALAVAKSVGIANEQTAVIEGDAMMARLKQGDNAFLDSISVVARAKPSQKLSLVQALQSRQEVVAVTGDGVNDVPALQAADIGIAMGRRGTRSSREIAAIVLLDDNFRSIVRAIAEGRQLFRNLQLSFEYLLTLHIPLVLGAALLPLAGYPLLFLPVHIVWLELIIHPTALLVFQDLPPTNRLSRHRLGRKVQFFAIAQWVSIGAAGLYITALVMWSFLRSLDASGDVEHARAMAMTVLTISSAGIAAYLSALRSQAARWIVVLTVVSSLMFTQLPWLHRILYLNQLHRDDWLIVALGVLSAVAILACGDLMNRAYNRRATGQAA